MKQFLLTLMTVIAFGGGLLAQTTIWTEDFSTGLDGWTSNNPACDAYQGGAFGTWRAASATFNGSNVDLTGVTYDWTFINPIEYTVNYFDDQDPGTAFTSYSRYEYAGDTLVSSIDNDALAVGPTFELFDPSAAGSRVLWSALLSDSADPGAVATWIGATDPLITFDGSSMTLTSQDGNSSVVFERISQCPNLWHWTPNGNWTAGFGVETLSFGSQILSPTRDNGSIIAVGHMQITLGDPNFDAGPPPYNESVSEIISPPIDISAANSGLALRWNQSFATVNPADDAPGGFPTSFAVSTDDGATWSAPVDMNEGAPANRVFRDENELAIPTNFIGGATSIRLKFTYAQDFYFFGLDDLALVERQPYEMQANLNFYAIAPNHSTPWSQLAPMAFMADIQNNGGATSSNVNLNISIFDESGSSIYSSDLNYGDIAPDSLAENSFIPGTFELAAEEGSVGRYVGVYALTHDNVAEEANTDNDTLAFDFFVTDTLFTKAPTFNRNVAPGADDSYLYGNVYYTPRGQGWFARTITFEMSNPQDIAGYQNNNATIQLYEWEGDTNRDGQANPEEYGNIPVAFFDYTFDGTESGPITVPVEDLDGEAIALQDDTYYMAIVQFVAAQADDSYFMQASEDSYAYGATVFITDSLNVNGIVPDQYGAVLEVGNPAGEAVEFSTTGFGRNLVPIVDMSIGLNGDLSLDPLIVVNTDEQLPANYVIQTFPNPASEFFNLSLDMPEMQDVSVLVYDLKGQTLFFQEYDDLQVGNFRYDTSTLPAGLYFVRINTDAGSRTLKVSVQR